jgi:MarR family transcriptional regulator for hemolysin
MPAEQPTASAAALFELTNTLQPIRRAWVQAAGIALADSGLSGSLATAVILTARCGDKGIGQSALAEEVGVNPGGMVHILDQAEAAGLLQRRDSTDDRRVKIVHVLPEGRRLAVKMERAVARLRAALLGDLPPEDIETATRVLRLFEERIGAFLRQERANR